MQVYVLQPLTPLGNLAESGIVSTSASLRCRLPRFPLRLAGRSLRSLAGGCAPGPLLPSLAVTCPLTRTGDRERCPVGRLLVESTSDSAVA